MAFPFDNFIKGRVNYYLGQTSPNRNMQLMASAQVSIPATGHVVALDSARRSATVMLADGSTQEHFLQNRYVRKGSAIGAIGQRVL